MAENGIEGLDGLFCDGDCIREDSEVFTKMNNFLAKYSNAINDEQSTQPFSWNVEFIKKLKKTEKGGVYAFYVVVEKGVQAGKIPYFCFAEDKNDYNQIIDFVDGKMVRIYGEELAKRITSSKVDDLIKGKADFNEIVKILTEDSKKNNSRYSPINVLNLISKYSVPEKPYVKNWKKEAPAFPTIALQRFMQVAELPPASVRSR